MWSSVYRQKQSHIGAIVLGCRKVSDLGPLERRIEGEGKDLTTGSQQQGWISIQHPYGTWMVAATNRSELPDA